MANEEHLPFEDSFDPNSFTERELLKLVHRDLYKLRMEFEDYRRNNDFQRKMNELELQMVQVNADIRLEEQKRKQSDELSERNNKRLIAIAGLILVIVQIGLAAVNGS